MVRWGRLYRLLTHPQSIPNFAATKGLPVNLFSGPRRIVPILLLTASGLSMWPAAAPRALAQAPTISTNQTAFIPRGTAQVNGTGFDPSTASKPIMVDLALTNSGGTFPLGVVQTDSHGAFSSAPVSLPLAIDIPATNQITAKEEGNTALGAGILVLGTALAPVINNGSAVSAHVGDQITVHGAGFAANDTLSVSLGGQPLTTVGGPAAIAADATGAITATIGIPLNSRLGAQPLTITGSATGTGQNDQGIATINLQPPVITTSLLVTPNPASAGTPIDVQAGGFQANEAVTFTLKYFDLSLGSYALKNAPTNADASGAASTVLSIPPTADPSQPATVIVKGNVSGVTYSQPLDLSSATRITFSPPTALPGAQIEILGSGFVSNENLFVTTRLFTPPVGAAAKVDSTGHFTATETILSSAPTGTALVVAFSGTSGDQGSADYTVAIPSPPSLQISPSSAPAGAQITATGHGMNAGEGVGFSILGNSLGMSGPPTIADPVGGFTATVTLPSTLAPGAYQLLAIGATSGISAQTTLNLTAPPRNQWYFAEGYTGQSASVSFQESITILNPTNQTANGGITYQFANGSTSSLPISLKPRSLLVENVNKDVGSNQIVSTLVKADQNIVADRVLTRKNGQGKTLDTDMSPGQVAPQPTWYFAEGYSGATFQPYLTVQNPEDTPITITATLAAAGSKPAIVNASLPPFGRYTLNLRSAYPGKSFSTTLTAGGPVVAERVQYWGDGVGSAKFGAGVKPGVPTPGTSWYFGYASILGGDQVFMSILNPNTQPAKVTAHFFDGTGKDTATSAITVAPGQRGTMALHNLLKTSTHSPVAVQLTSTLPVVAEEAQYFGASPNVGSHPGADIEGNFAPSARWSFAAGNTAADQEYEYVLNPGSAATVLTGTFYGADGQVVSASYPVPAHTVVTISANAVPGLHKGVHGSVWTTKGNTGVVVVQVLRGADGRSALASQGVPG